MYINADTAGNGVGQITEQQIGINEEPVTYNFVSGWVYITQGSAGIGWYEQDDQQTHIVASTSTLDQWVYLSANLQGAQSLGFVILATSPNSTFTPITWTLRARRNRRRTPGLDSARWPSSDVLVVGANGAEASPCGDNGYG